MHDLIESGLTFEELLEAVRQEQLPGSSRPVEVRKVAHDETEEFYTAILDFDKVYYPGSYAGRKPQTLKRITEETVFYRGKKISQIKVSFILREEVIVVENYLTELGSLRHRLTICHPEWQVDGGPELNMEKIIWKLQQRELVRI